MCCRATVIIRNEISTATYDLEYLLKSQWHGRKAEGASQMNYQLNFLHNRCHKPLLICFGCAARPCPARGQVRPNRGHCKWGSSSDSGYHQLILLGRNRWAELCGIEYPRESLSYNKPTISPTILQDCVMQICEQRAVYHLGSCPKCNYIKRRHLKIFPFMRQLL